MSAEHTCFVISPIGEPDTEVRQSADDFFDLIVQPSVEKFGFSVKRADRIPGPGSISEDILRYVQESDLCIVDLTGHNPNVFYECGRRHEAGRPCIQLIETSQKIPFDLSGIRTIRYNLSDPRSIRRTVVEIQAFIEEIRKSGFSSSSSGASMSAIADTLTRIERRIMDIGVSPQSAEGGPEASLLTNPVKAMQEAIVQGNLSALVGLLPRLENALGAKHDAVVQAASVVALNGIVAGASALKRALEADTEELGTEAFMAAVSSMVQYYVTTDDKEEGAKYLESVINKGLEERGDLDGSQKAYLYNQHSMVQHGAGYYEEALSSLERALELAPDDRSYLYNLSVVYESMGMLGKSCGAASRSIADQGKPDVDHLAHAVGVFAKAGRGDDAGAALERLKRIDSARAKFVATETGNSQ
ncbi:MAG: hypothetical protein OXQ31_06825 [Spirochaetaceae bacterium]|nr:hypothetical protein [Spirochaetaceae bacterium]